MSSAVRAERQTATIVPPGTWTIDPTHSSLEFAVKHMMIAPVRGRFTDFEGSLEADAAGTARASGTVGVASIDTGERDDHLRSQDFFDAETYPEIRFESHAIERVPGDTYRVVGDLTIKGTTREVELEATVQGAGLDPWGNERVALEVCGELSRKDFGLTWNQALETGGALVGDRVEIGLDISSVRAADRTVA